MRKGERDGMSIKVGGWNFDEFKGVRLPQKAASAFSAAAEGLTGASYVPLLYVGTQVVNGTNYAFIALQTLILAEPKKRIVKLVINESSAGKYSIVSVTPIIKE